MWFSISINTAWPSSLNKLKFLCCFVFEVFLFFYVAAKQNVFCPERRWYLKISPPNNPPTCTSLTPHTQKHSLRVDCVSNPPPPQYTEFFLLSFLQAERKLIDFPPPCHPPATATTPTRKLILGVPKRDRSYRCWISRKLNFFFYYFIIFMYFFWPISKRF